MSTVFTLRFPSQHLMTGELQTCSYRNTHSTIYVYCYALLSVDQPISTQYLLAFLLENVKLDTEGTSREYMFPIDFQVT